MSASLVGSEMCIRDRHRVDAVEHGVEVRRRRVVLTGGTEDASEEEPRLGAALLVQPVEEERRDDVHGLDAAAREGPGPITFLGVQ
eukprot:2824730-Alexandrium_andersonii.AAC.1